MLHRRLLFSRGPTLNRPAQAVKRSIETSVYTRVHPRPPTTDHRPPTTDHRPPTTDHRPPTTDHQPALSDRALRPRPFHARGYRRGLPRRLSLMRQVTAIALMSRRTAAVARQDPAVAPYQQLPRRHALPGLVVGERLGGDDQDDKIGRAHV